MDEIFDNAKIIEACYQAVKDWSIAIPQGAKDVEFVLETIAGMHNLLKDRDGTEELYIKLRADNYKLQYEYKNSDDTVRSLRAALADNNDTRQMQLNRAAELLNLIVGESMTHGQKNGAILLVIATLRKMAQDDLYLGDIPF